LTANTDPSISRRSLLRAGAGGLAALALLKATASRPAQAQLPASGTPGPLAWVWRFDADGNPEQIRAHLASLGIGVLYKVYDGTNWMGRFDRKSPIQVHGPADVRTLAEFFESAGVPFHAWGVANGTDPITEARMAAEVLNNGARSLTFDLELPEGSNYWHAGPYEAAVLGEELRRLHPDAYLSVAPDARPWQVTKLPMAEFAAFCDDIAPQTYWETFDSPGNHRLLAQYGFPVGAEGTTPELILDATMDALERFGRPVRPIGQGAAARAGWDRFAAHASSLGMGGLSVWRYGTASKDSWDVLSASHGLAPVAPEPSQAPRPPRTPTASVIPAETAPPEDSTAPAARRRRGRAGRERRPFSLGFRP